MNWWLVIIAAMAILGIYSWISEARERAKKRLADAGKPGPLESTFIEMQKGWDAMSEEDKKITMDGAEKLIKGYAKTGTLRGAIKNLAEDEKPKEEPSKKDPEIWI